jgi:hypothetical protein
MWSQYDYIVTVCQMGKPTEFRSPSLSQVAVALGISLMTVRKIFYQPDKCKMAKFVQIKRVPKEKKSRGNNKQCVLLNTDVKTVQTLQ